MSNIIRNVAIITKINSDEAYRTAREVSKLLLERKVDVYSIDPLKGDNMTAIAAECAGDHDLDLILAIGGDGTTLKAFRIPPFRIPVLSVNIGGHKGSLSELESGSVEYIVQSILSGNHFYDCRMRIEAFIDDIRTPPVLNDILLTKSSLTRTPLLSITMLGEKVEDKMDGIIISTPTGSTGHSFSLGGPVIQESLHCMMLSPIASISRFPAVVLPVEDIQISSSHESILILDGQETHTIPAGQGITISRSPIDACFLRIKKKGTRQLEKLGFT
jgi:NAD+ kinase